MKYTMCLHNENEQKYVQERINKPTIIAETSWPNIPFDTVNIWVGIERLYFSSRPNTTNDSLGWREHSEMYLE